MACGSVRKQPTSWSPRGGSNKEPTSFFSCECFARVAIRICLAARQDLPRAARSDFARELTAIRVVLTHCQKASYEDLYEKRGHRKLASRVLLEAAEL